MARVKKSCLTLTNWTFGSFKKDNICALLDKLALRNRGVGQKKNSGPLHVTYKNFFQCTTFIATNICRLRIFFQLGPSPSQKNKTQKEA
jgi:hypothetical protein